MSSPPMLLVVVEGSGTEFVRGDSNGDGSVTISDAVLLLAALFAGGQQPACEDAADADDNGQLQLGDAILQLNALFLGAGPLPAPASCGLDPTSDARPCKGQQRRALSGRYAGSCLTVAPVRPVPHLGRSL